MPRLFALSLVLLLGAWLALVPADRARLHSILAPSDAAGGPPSSAERAMVRSVIDGDTILLEDGRMVRILGIDTPETKHPDMDGPQPFGAEAAARLRDLVEGRSVALERDVGDTDHFGRSLRHVWLGRDLVARILLEEGLGYTLLIPPNLGHEQRLRAAEAAARDARLGLWGAGRPTPLPIFGLSED